MHTINIHGFDCFYYKKIKFKAYLNFPGNDTLKDRSGTDTYIDQFMSFAFLILYLEHSLQCSNWYL